MNTPLIHIIRVLQNKTISPADAQGQCCCSVGLIHPNKRVLLLEKVIARKTWEVLSHEALQRARCRTQIQDRACVIYEVLYKIILCRNLIHSLPPQRGKRIAQSACQSGSTNPSWRALIEPRAQNTITSDIAIMTFTFAFGDLAANFFHAEKGTVINFIADIIPCQLYVPDA